MPDRPEIRIGDEHYVLRPFRGLKSVLILGRITKLLDVLPEIQAQARREFRKQRDENVRTLPRATFEFLYPVDAERVSEAAWEAAGQEMQVPEDTPLDTGAVLMSILPRVLDLARSDVMEILALVVMRDSDLQAADEQDTVDEEIEKQAKKLLYDGTLEELADLGSLAFSQVQELNSGKVKALFEQASTLLSPEEGLDDPSPDLSEGSTEGTGNSNETSSTSSPESTDGPENKPSGSDSTTSSPTPVG
ncbi:MAG: hypothetical protein J0H98_08175 [Solirubrobacterales bacterium]|nr:hypothetical protein [Solirubrobacterales bacterium]